MMDRNAASSRMDHGVEGAQAEWLGAMQSLAEQIQKQQQNSQQMIQELMNTYMQLLNTPGSYISGQAEQQQQTLQQTVQQWMEQAQQQQQMFQQQAQQQQQSFQQMAQETTNTYMQMFNIPHSYLQEGLRLAQEDTPGTPKEESRDAVRKSQRRSAGQSS
jgi:gas vesicle protein